MQLVRSSGWLAKEWCFKLPNFTKCTVPCLAQIALPIAVAYDLLLSFLYAVLAFRSTAMWASFVRCVNSTIIPCKLNIHHCAGISSSVVFLCDPTHFADHPFFAALTSVNSPPPSTNWALRKRWQCMSWNELCHAAQAVQGWTVLQTKVENLGISPRPILPWPDCPNMEYLSGCVVSFNLNCIISHISAFSPSFTSWLENSLFYSSAYQFTTLLWWEVKCSDTKQIQSIFDTFLPILH